MNEIFFYSILSVLIVSLISFAGIFTLGINIERLRKILIYLISFSAGALFGDVFIHLLPELAEKGISLLGSSLVLVGIVSFFFLEKIIHWQHCHMPITENHVHSFAYTNLVGDALHNFIDGTIIVAGYLVSVPAGIATTLAVLLHEIPQEIGDFGVLLHAGFSKGRALLLNFTSALTSVIGALFALWLGSRVADLASILIPLTIGGFIYIAGSDLIPELHKDSNNLGRSLLQLISFIIGILIMFALVFIE